jgi:hypothetical protein
MKRLAVLLAVTSPLASLLWADAQQQRLVWYTLSAALLAGCLFVLAALAKSRATCLAILCGAAVQVAAMWCGLSVGGSCDSPDSVPWVAIGVLLVVSLVAEAVQKLEIDECRRKTTDH